MNGVKLRVAASSLTTSQNAAFAEMVRQHASRPAALNGKTVGEMIIEEHAYAMALRMAASARASDRARRLQMNALLAASAVVSGSTGSRFGITLSLHNKTARTVKSLDCGIEVRSAGKLLGTAEFDLDQAIGPHAAARATVLLPYEKFGGDARAVRNARGRHLIVVLDIKQIAYLRGGAAGTGD